jgi:hypothetical protein
MEDSGRESLDKAESGWWLTDFWREMLAKGVMETSNERCLAGANHGLFAFTGGYRLESFIANY